MGKVTWRPTPALYAVGECEGFYEAMAAKGWLLEKRGTFFDRYRRGEPRALRCRLEIAGSSPSDGAEPLPEEQLQLYEDCGWTLAARRGEVYVFRAPADSEIPEIYDDGAQQAAMLAGLKKHYRNKVISALFWIGWLFASSRLRGFSLFSSKTLAEAGFLLAGIFAFWLLMTWRAVHGAVMIRLLLGRLKKGAPIDRAAARRKRFRLHRAVTGALVAAALLCLAGAGVEALLRSTSPLPASAGGLPYLLGEEVFDARRAGAGEVPSFGREINYVKSEPTLFAPVQYRTHESFVLGDGSVNTLYQNVYRTWNAGLANRLAWSLAEHSIFAEAGAYARAEVDGLDLALAVPGGLELIAVKGNTVVYALYIDAGDGDDLARLLEAYARKL